MPKKIYKQIEFEIIQFNNSDILFASIETDPIFPDPYDDGGV